MLYLIFFFVDYLKKCYVKSYEIQKECEKKKEYPSQDFMLDVRDNFDMKV